MSWSKSELKRSYACNPELIKFLRRRKKWSQKQLAKNAGYCERLICKAESGGNIASATIEVLAKTLSSNDMKIYPEDLISDPAALAKKFIEAVHTLQRDLVKGIAHFTDPGGEFHIPQFADGDYAGVYRGLAAFNEAAGRFFDAQSIVQGQDFASRYKYYGEANEVVCWGVTTIRVNDTGELFDTEITLRLSFKKGKLYRLENRSKILVDSAAEPIA